MTQAQQSVKREKIDKSMSTMVLAASIAVFLFIFSVSTSHSLWDKLKFQNKVITAKTTARNQLNSDLSAANQLSGSYNNFNDASSNLLGGAVTGKDNDNAKVVLDALPSIYDYPALTTSIQSLLNNQGVTISSISGSDESTTIGATTSSNAPVPIPITISVSGPYQNIQNVITTFEKSTRPFQFLTLTLSGDQSNISLNINAQTFFQPPKEFTTTNETIK